MTAPKLFVPSLRLSTALKVLPTAPDALKVKLLVTAFPPAVKVP